MGAKQSSEMTKALKLLRADPSMSAYAAAKKAGVTASAICQNKEWRTILEERKKYAK